MPPWKSSGQTPVNPALLVNAVQSKSHPEWGYGMAEKGEQPDGALRVKFKDGVQTVPIDDIILPTGDKELPSSQKPQRKRNTYDESVNYASAPEFQPFLQWLWKNAEIIWQGTAEDAEEFTKWYEGETGQPPKGRGFYVDRQIGHRDYSQNQSMRIDWPQKTPLPGDIVRPKDEELKVTYSGGKGHISSTAFAKQLIHNYGFRLGKQPKTDFPRLQAHPAADPLLDAPAQDDTIPTEESIKNIDQFLGK
jgi:hypothetical protein